MKRPYLLFILLLLLSFTFVQAQTVEVTFKVDMKVQILKGVFSPADDTVSVNGSFNDWSGGVSILTDEDVDSVYVGTFAVAENETHNFKYWMSGDEAPNSGWETIADNRSVTVTTESVVLEIVKFDNEEMPSGDPVSITFNVDMRIPAVGDFDPATDTVKVTGNFRDWGTSSTAALAMTDADNDLTYTATTTVNSAQLLKYKYIWGTAPSWESVDDRPYWVTDTPDTINNFWNDVDPDAAELVDGAITFNFDIEPLLDLGLFDPATDSVEIRGSFNGWGAGSKMDVNPFVPSQFFKTQDFVQTEIEAEQTYKYYVDVVDQEGPLGGDQGYERPFSTGGGDRQTLFEGVEDQQVPIVYFGDIKPQYIIEAGKTLAITFSVDMTSAADAATQGPNAFDSATDTVYWVPQQALFAATQGWEEGEDRALMLTDANSDMVYEGTMNITAPSFNGFMYIYQYYRDGAPINETTALGTTHSRRVRFIPMDGDKDFGDYETSTYVAGQDSWSNSTDKSAQSDAPPLGNYTSVGDKFDVPSAFELSQNYPNPFNPTTKIKFTVPQNGKVSLKIFSVIGQLVETILDQDMNAGSYVADFNARHLSSGVYFYVLKSGTHVASKKMMLLK